ncbi:MAG: HEAT repeat domain-containing protein [Planctomycetes bacterium]|nr:HEAT repeat domain-containing protein [Planctomycetota bacterium]
MIELAIRTRFATVCSVVLGVFAGIAPVLAQTDPQADFEAAVEWLKNPIPQERIRALDRLEGIAFTDQEYMERSGEAIAAALTDADPTVRVQAIFSLGILMGSSMAVTVTGKVEELPAHPKAAEYARQIFPLAADPDERVRERVAWALGHMRSQEALSLVVAFLDDVSPAVQGAAIDALTQLGAAEYTDRIRAFLDAEDARAVGPAIDAMKAFGMTESAEDIAKHLGHQGRGVRGRAIEALVRLGSKRHASSIAPLVNDPEWYVRFLALQALMAFDARGYVDQVAERLDDEHPWNRALSRHLLGAWGAKKYAGEIAEGLEDGESAVREAAMAALADLQADEFIPQIGALLKGQSISAALALGKLGAKEFAGEIAGLTKSDNEWIRAAGAEALGLLGDRKHTPVLRALLSDGSEKVREKAAEALNKMHPGPSTPFNGLCVTRQALEWAQRPWWKKAGEWTAHAGLAGVLWGGMHWATLPLQRGLIGMLPVVVRAAPFGHMLVTPPVARVLWVAAELAVAAVLGDRLYKGFKWAASAPWRTRAAASAPQSGVNDCVKKMADSVE